MDVANPGSSYGCSHLKTSLSRFSQTKHTFASQGKRFDNIEKSLAARTLYSLSTALIEQSLINFRFFEPNMIARMQKRPV